MIPDSARNQLKPVARVGSMQIISHSLREISGDLLGNSPDFHRKQEHISPGGRPLTLSETAVGGCAQLPFVEA